MRNRKQSYAEQISAAQVMLAGLQANLERLERRGMTPEFITAMDANLGSIIGKNNEQEKLKADLKAATAALDALMAQMAKSMSEAAKVVKLEMPQEQWKEFGMAAKR
jgi:hypothetical protein